MPRRSSTPKPKARRPAPADSESEADTASASDSDLSHTSASSTDDAPAVSAGSGRGRSRSRSKSRSTSVKKRGRKASKSRHSDSDEEEAPRTPVKGEVAAAVANTTPPTDSASDQIWTTLQSQKVVGALVALVVIGMLLKTTNLGSYLWTAVLLVICFMLCRACCCRSRQKPWVLDVHDELDGTDAIEVKADTEIQVQYTKGTRQNWLSWDSQDWIGVYHRGANVKKDWYINCVPAPGATGIAQLPGMPAGTYTIHLFEGRKYDSRVASDIVAMSGAVISSTQKLHIMQKMLAQAAAEVTRAENQASQSSSDGGCIVM